MIKLGDCVDRETAEVGRSCFRAVIWSVLLSVVAYLGFIVWSGWQEVVEAVIKIGLVGVLIALLLSLVNYSVRFFRWHGYLKLMNSPVEWVKNITIYIAGFSLTTTPGKAGEMLRGVFLKREGVSYSTSFAVFISERLSDLLAIVILALIGLYYYPAAQSLVFMVSLIMLFIFWMISNESLINRMAIRFEKNSGFCLAINHMMTVLIQVKSCHSPVVLFRATLLSLFAWGAEGLAFYLVLSLMGVDISLFLVMFIYSVSLLAGVISFMPGGLGGVEAAMVGLLILNGVSGAEAVSSTVVIRLTTLWFAVVLGMFALIHLDRREIKDCA